MRFGYGSGFHVILALVLVAGCGDDGPPTGPGSGPHLVRVEFDIGADEYLNNRFFALDDPLGEAQGRRAGERIDPGSILVFRRIDAGALGPDDVADLAGYVDREGCRAWPDLDFTAPFVVGDFWRTVWAFDLMRDPDGNLLGLDLRAEQAPDAVLAVVYTVVDATGAPVAQVGDDPRLGGPQQALPGHAGLYYRVKMLKAAAAADDPKLFGYVRRNIYDIGRWHLDPSELRLRIEALDDPTDPALATPTLPWLQLFGLDQLDLAGNRAPDGLPDCQDAALFDLERGLIRFPVNNPRPFAAEPAQYQAYALPEVYPWEGSYLADHLAPELYDPATAPDDYPAYRHFAIRGSYLTCEIPVDTDPTVSLERTR